MSQAVIIVILAAVTACGGYLSFKRLTKGGGCCGEHEAADAFGTCIHTIVD